MRLRCEAVVAVEMRQLASDFSCIRTTSVVGRFEDGLRVPGIVWWPGACNDARARVFYVQACCDGAAMAVV